MSKRRIIKDKKIKSFLKNGGRDSARKDFFELLKRSARTSIKPKIKTPVKN
ncbi:MAG TPA: hypothetical protein VLG67_05040 [Candidatus Saccharimonadales bacterium]|nr:hypothetical protein [Candidatus Saccharimonadales bacterium]